MPQTLRWGAGMKAHPNVRKGTKNNNSNQIRS